MDGSAGAVPDCLTEPTSADRGYRFPPDIISQAVWLYFRFNLGFRGVQDLLADPGVVVSHGAIREGRTKLVRRMLRDFDSVEPDSATSEYQDEMLLKIRGTCPASGARHRASDP